MTQDTQAEGMEHARGERELSPEVRELIQLPESLPVRELKVESAPDRYGAVGLFAASVDQRPGTVEFCYDFYADRDQQYFSDDHRRSLNGHVTERGGRDDRFIYNKAKERREYMDALKERRAALEQALRERLPSARIRYQETINPVRSSTNRDDEGELRSHARQEAQGWWSLVDHEGQLIESITSAATWMETSEDFGAVQNKNTYEDAIVAGNQKATEVLRARLKELEAAEQDPDVLALREALDDCTKELLACESSVSVSWPVALVSEKSSPEQRAQEAEALLSEVTSAPPRYKASAGAPLPTSLGLQEELRWYRALGLDVQGEGVVDFRVTEGQERRKARELERLRDEAQGNRNGRYQEEERQEAMLLELGNDWSAKEREAAKAREAAEAQARQEREALARAEREAALTPEVRAQIDQGFREADALLRIVRGLPNRTPEQAKLQAAAGKYGTESLESRYHQGAVGAEAAQELERLQAGLRDLCGRKKINEEIPGLSELVSARMEAWRTIPDVVRASQDAQDFLEMSGIEEAHVVQLLSDAYLDGPAGQSPEEALSTVLNDLLANV